MSHTLNPREYNEVNPTRASGYVKEKGVVGGLLLVALYNILPKNLHTLCSVVAESTGACGRLIKKTVYGYGSV